jgi:hypothetical protein
MIIKRDRKIRRTRRGDARRNTMRRIGLKAKRDKNSKSSMRSSLLTFLCYDTDRIENQKIKWGHRYTDSKVIS